MISKRRTILLMIPSLLATALLLRAATQGATQSPPSPTTATRPFEPAAPLPPDLKLLTLFDGKSLDAWTQLPPPPPDSWIIKDDALASTGLVRGVLYTKDDYTSFRLLFSIRHLSVAPGNKDHDPCILFFCTRPVEGQKPLDALAGVQFQVPSGYTWDYRKGHNNAGKDEFTRLPHPKFDVHEWARVELLVNADTGSARLAVAQPPGSKALEIATFHDPAAAKKGPIALQMHNAGLFDEYKDIQIETNPVTNDLLTTK